MQARTFRRALAVAVLAVAAVTATVALSPLLRSPAAAVATGEFVNGVPVYRLPNVNVVASRKAELARMAQEENALASAKARQ